ncbi:DRMBL-domain-containing protein [Sodiomyces alkalinus F11]|uniref:DRMBL-domain-containing protein n=1 Tax=Sodiomyces alkalinus (strain CBS 110278 / VKM F-3762 / F11) TaxID=1314773 RepID=A0A3N2PRY5_SODAK|nr:DRMBL-domain-containing protein [Sodiomyces alkalinus F11]ROT37267.1 DRMBL-domain-containing protein [Sodiomyces alkalinus F11]
MPLGPAVAASLTTTDALPYCLSMGLIYGELPLPTLYRITFPTPFAFSFYYSTCQKMGTPTSSRKRSSMAPRRPVSKFPPPSKKPSRPNASILNFFQKTEKEEQALFIGEVKPSTSPSAVSKQEDSVATHVLGDIIGEDDIRYNESGSTVKRRKLSKDEAIGNEKDQEDAFEDEADSSSGGQGRLAAKTPGNSLPTTSAKKKTPSVKRKGPFLEESDTESEDAETPSKPKLSFSTPGKVPDPVPIASEDVESKTPGKDTSCPPPPLKQDDDDDNDDNDAAVAAEFAHLDDYPGGEEYRMMLFMEEEQARLEAAECDDTLGSNGEPDTAAETMSSENSSVTNCPICDGSLAGVSPVEATRHVNACLDGNPIPLPEPEKKTNKKDPGHTSPPLNVDGPELGKRFARATVPRPGQMNPFRLDENGGKPKSNSAFAELMSSHAESAAWATAAAAEQASRGRPAYERTCPFYKIMPGFSICVDAFRYGAVKGCNAYFLSHFHSDHYIGLTANWSHGPIYCSTVTADLVKMQLRTAEKWVVPLEFEQKVEIPDTDGATVTMIPANHCPGSSMFLFEKTMGKGPNAKTQRILHCGDFRACPAHVTHPLLKPYIRDAITGKTRQQKIDVCYLDTTYLNPRYSFPPQEDVVRACAELCASLSPDPNSTDDLWDRLGRKNATASVSKFFISAKQADAPQESSAVDDDGTVAQAETSTADSSFFSNRTGKNPPTPRQRLLVICGTYSIGKERICKALAQALNTKIFASPAKMRICAKLGDPELTALLTSNPLEAQVHMQMLMEIRAETLREYLDSYRPHFSRIVGFRPSGWNYRPRPASASSSSSSLSAPGAAAAPVSVTASTTPGSVPTTQMLHSSAWRSRFTVRDMTPQRGSARDAMCFGVPYSEHSSFRELALFVMGLRIERIVPTVNVGSEASRRRMKGWTDRWVAERRRGGLVIPLVRGEDGGEGEEGKAGITLWDGKDGRGGGAWW